MISPIPNHPTASWGSSLPTRLKARVGYARINPVGSTPPYGRHRSFHASPEVQSLEPIVSTRPKVAWVYFFIRLSNVRPFRYCLVTITLSICN